MFAYCNNNPVIFSDSSGSRCVIAGTHLNEGARKKYYETADEAAKAFAEEVYESAMYTRHEFGAEIFSSEINGVTMYSYSTPRIGKPHEVMVGYPTPPNTVYVAFVHIHPNYDYFSQGDKDIANKRNINAYVVGSSKQLRMYDSSTFKSFPIGQIHPIQLMEFQYTSRKQMSWYTWGSHLNDGCHKPNNSCNNKVWPAW